jgi:hypothetical protein
MSAYKIFKTLFFLQNNRERMKAGALTYEEIKNHILETWGDEVLQLFMTGEKQIADFMTWLQAPEDEKLKWIELFNRFTLRLKDEKLSRRKNP